jgi:hypothetical protein
MKKIFTIAFFLAAVSSTSAQWSDVNNNFEDSLHMPVCTALSTQTNPIVLTSYPDGGYFVIWEDNRNTATTKTDIYAQKYDKTGKRLWAVNGVPVSNGPNTQRFTFSSNQDYRSRSLAATDSAGGFYLAYIDDSLTNYSWERMTVQHMRSNGTAVFASPGYIVAQSGGQQYAFSHPQLIADGNKGFFIAYKQSYDYVHVYCYRDENGSMKLYGGGRVNENAIQTSSIAQCGIKTDVVYPGTSVTEFNIWSDGQGGCNVIMDMGGNIAGQGRMLTYNRVWRAKKDAKAKTFFRNTSAAACPRISEYKKGDVYVLYYIVRDFQTVVCGGGGGPVYTYTNYRLLANGYQVIDNQGYDYNYPKGVNLPTAGNINVDMIAVTKRTYENSIVSPFIVQGYVIKSENFDSIPYQRTSFNNPDIGYNPTPPVTLNKLNSFRDTLLAASTYFTDFSLASGGTHIYASALMGSGARVVRLQNMEVTRKAADSFAIEYKTSVAGPPQKTGVAIGAEVSTGFGGTNISYDYPIVTVAKNGKAFFHTREYYRSARVSPIESGAELAWGAMGKPVCPGVYNASFYNFEQPVVALDSTGSSGIIAWRDNKFIPGNTGENIFMRHLDKLDVLNYVPPIKKVKPLYFSSTEMVANPAVLLGSSTERTTLEVYDPGSYATSPIAEIRDDIYFGSVHAHVYEKVGAIRRYNNDAYLSRNYTFKTDSVTAGVDIDMFLYFTKQQFDALKGTDNSIIDPSYLAVVRQPNTTLTAPAAYTPVAGEELITPIVTDSVNGGYFMWILSKGLGNFFIRKIATSIVCNTTATSFTSTLTGATYQWQVNTGGVNFVNITNGGNYSGTNTVTLQISNIPASFSGYRYRCVVNNSKVSNTFYLQVANTWTGAVNNQWETAGNWSCNKVPDANTDVIINSGSVTVNSTTDVCRTLKIHVPANVTVGPGFKLTVTK